MSAPDAQQDNDTGFLPAEYRSSTPTFLVWWTGTLGQAEWLISHSTVLRGHSQTRSCDKRLTELPEKLKPLLALEQPDLLITLADGTPLLSIEITEQQEFGTNAQQRMARFWSAAACGVPSAYLLPVESYQIEKATSAECEPYFESDAGKRKFLLFCATLIHVRGETMWERGVRTPERLLGLIRAGDLPLPPDRLRQLQSFVRRFVDHEGDVLHLASVPPDERVHQVGDEFYKVYIRKPEVTSSMVLRWFGVVSKVTPAYPFKLHSTLESMFATNGLQHTHEDPAHPHLSYRNLPPSPGSSPVVHRKAGLDEISLFFKYVDAVLSRKPIGGLHRDLLTEPGEYFDAQVMSDWFSIVSSAAELTTKKSGDFQLDLSTFSTFLSTECGERGREASTALRNFSDVYVYKIQCSARIRPLADPYSGNLAVRDMLFCRKGESVGKLTEFQRSAGLVFMVDLTGEAASDHPFLDQAIRRRYRALQPRGNASDAQDMLVELFKQHPAWELDKGFRCHVIFSDLIIVRRHLPHEVRVEVFRGLPALLRAGQVKPTDPVVRSLTV